MRNGQGAKMSAAGRGDASILPARDLAGKAIFRPFSAGGDLSGGYPKMGATAVSAINLDTSIAWRRCERGNHSRSEWTTTLAVPEVTRGASGPQRPCSAAACLPRRQSLPRFRAGPILPQGGERIKTPQAARRTQLASRSIRRRVCRHQVCSRATRRSCRQAVPRARRRATRVASLPPNR